MKGKKQEDGHGDVVSEVTVCLRDEDDEEDNDDRDTSILIRAGCRLLNSRRNRITVVVCGVPFVYPDLARLPAPVVGSIGASAVRPIPF